MPEPLVIAVAQPYTVSHDVRGNALRHAEAVRAAGADVVVFPELSLTGYHIDATPIDPGDLRLHAIVEACGETGSTALAGAPVEGDAGMVHIAMVAIDGDGVSPAYRKMWLGGTEADRYSAGDSPVVITVDGWRLGLAICKDTGVPDHALTTAGLGMDVYVAGALESVEDSDVLPARARRVATDHGVPVAVASFAGSTGGGYTRAAGCSAIWDRNGSVLAQAPTDVGAIARAAIDRSEVGPVPPR